jgi:hypothetical protein
LPALFDCGVLKRPRGTISSMNSTLAIGRNRRAPEFPPHGHLE